jgi:uncharacterized OB-fold protein
MGLRFKLRGMAETFIDSIKCPKCGALGHDDTHFTTELTRVTNDGIIVVMECKTCSEIFVPITQRLGVINSQSLRSAVEKETKEQGSVFAPTLATVRLDVEKLNAVRRDEIQ